MNGRPALTVLIPAYNEHEGLATCVEAVRVQLAAMSINFEFLIVDDGSSDGTGQIADRLAADLPGLRVVHHAQNQGIGGAFRTGVANAGGELLILIPADLGLVPTELPKYFEAAGAADIVVGVRSDVSDYSAFRRLVHYANIRLLQLLFGVALHEFQWISLYRLATLKNIDVEYCASPFFFAEVLIKTRALGARLVEVKIRYLPRRTGQATGAHWRQIAGTLRDISLFWWRWLWLGPVTASRRQVPALDPPRL